MAEDRACDHGCVLGRREFIGAAALTALALLQAACGDGEVGGTGPEEVTSGGPLLVRVASFTALSAVGGVARVDNGSGTPVALVRTGAATFAALSLRCPHAGTTVNLSGSGFLCPNHGARFSNTGQWQGGEPTRSLTTLSSTYDAAAGTVTVSR